MPIEEFFLNNLLELLLGIILSFNVAAYKLLWNRITDLEAKAEKNAESVDVILKRIFGFEQDPTDEGYIMETEKRFDEIGDKLQEICDKQDEMMERNKREHDRVDSKISSIIRVIAEEERIDVERDDFEGES